MMKIAVGIVAVLVLATAGLGKDFKCFECTSDTSWSDCPGNSSTPVVTCPSGENRCFKLEMVYATSGSNVKNYTRGCMTKDDCNSETVLKDCSNNDGTCTLDCCDKGECNAGTSTVVSAVLILPCVLLAMFHQ